MFDVYLNDKRDLLVVRKGSPIPELGYRSNRWRKKKRIISVSAEIGRAVGTHGYYLREINRLKTRQ